MVEALTAKGFVASLQPVASGVQLCQYHCPVAHVAAEFPELCEAETRAFSQMLDSHVQRLAAIAHGDGVCTTHVPRPVTRPGDQADPARAASRAYESSPEGEEGLHEYSEKKLDEGKATTMTSAAPTAPGLGSTQAEHPAGPRQLRLRLA